MLEEFISQAILLSKTLDKYLVCGATRQELLSIKQKFDKLLEDEYSRK